MIYRLHHSRHPFDPNRRTYASIDEFHDVNQAFAEHSNPIHAYADICKRWPDAVFMPATVRIGSGSTVLLGVLRNITEHGAAKSGEIPFVAWVRAEPTGWADHKLMRNQKGNPFDRRFWRTPVRHAPNTGAVCVKAELRASDLETPSPGEATIWNDGTSLVVHMEVGGGEISIAVPLKSVRRIAGECTHAAHFECQCGACVCAFCEAPLPGPTNVLKTLGYICDGCSAR